MSNLHNVNKDHAPTSPRPVFESLDHRVSNPADIDNLISEALSSQRVFTKRTTPWEKQNWDDDELEAFRIDIDQVDRLYHINYIEEENVKYPMTEYEMLARQKYKNGYIYVELIGKCDYSGFDSYKYVPFAFINISEDANFFLRNVSNSCYPMTRIRQSLTRDGIVIKPPRVEICHWKPKI